MREFLHADLHFLLNPSIPPGPKLLCMTMLAYSDTGKWKATCQIGHKDLAKTLRVNAQTIAKWTKWLEKAKHIERLSLPSSGAATIYKIRI